MMRVRISNGKSNSAQFRALAHIGQEHGKGFVDLTTRQHIQLRWFTIDHVSRYGTAWKKWDWSLCRREWTTLGRWWAAR